MGAESEQPCFKFSGRTRSLQTRWLERLGGLPSSLSTSIFRTALLRCLMRLPSSALACFGSRCGFARCADREPLEGQKAPTRRVLAMMTVRNSRPDSQLREQLLARVSDARPGRRPECDAQDHGPEYGANVLASS